MEKENKNQCFFSVFILWKQKQLFEVTRVLLKLKRSINKHKESFNLASYKLENERNLNKKDYNLYKITQIVAKDFDKLTQIAAKDFNKLTKRPRKKHFQTCQKDSKKRKKSN